MGLYVFVPLDEAVCGVCEVADLQYEKDVLTGENVYRSFKERAENPCYPLFAESQKDEHAVCDTYGRCARVKVADYNFKQLSFLLNKSVPRSSVVRKYPTPTVHTMIPMITGQLLPIR